MSVPYSRVVIDLCGYRGCQLKVVVLGDGKSDFTRILTLENSDKKKLFLALLPYFHETLLEVNNCCTWKKLFGSFQSFSKCFLCCSLYFLNSVFIKCLTSQFIL